MSTFGKTIIVDGSASPIVGERYNTIQAAIADEDNNDLSTNGGTIIVESGTYTIASSSDTITVPSNVSIIGRGNAVCPPFCHSVTSFPRRGQEQTALTLVPSPTSGRGMPHRMTVLHSVTGFLMMIVWLFREAVFTGFPESHKYTIAIPL